MNFESTKHPVIDDRRIDVLLAGYAARTLEPAFQALIAAHLELVPDSRAYIAALEAVHGVFLAGLDPVPLPGRDRKLVNIFASAPHDADAKVVDAPPLQQAQTDILPQPLRRFIGCDLTELTFVEVLPGIEQAAVGPGREAVILRCRPGARFRAHGHTGTEAMLVLAGSFSDEQGTYGRGGVAVADETVSHQPVAGPDGLVGFLAAEGPPAGQGTIGRLIGRVLGG